MARDADAAYKRLTELVDSCADSWELIALYRIVSRRVAPLYREWHLERWKASVAAAKDRQAKGYERWERSRKALR